jgi:hypothetical protein
MTHIPRSLLEHLGFSGLMQGSAMLKGSRVYITVNVLLITMIIWLNVTDSSTNRVPWTSLIIENRARSPACKLREACVKPA